LNENILVKTAAFCQLFNKHVDDDDDDDEAPLRAWDVIVDFDRAQ